MKSLAREGVPLNDIQADCIALFSGLMHGWFPVRYPDLEDKAMFLFSAQRSLNPVAKTKKIWKLYNLRGLICKFSHL